MVSKEKRSATPVKPPRIIPLNAIIRPESLNFYEYEFIQLYFAGGNFINKTEVKKHAYWLDGSSTIRIESTGN